MAMSEATHDEPSVGMGAETCCETVTDYIPRRAVDWGRSATAWIIEHPELGLGLALALGVGVGLAVKRR